jgi:hypothetical protein
VPDACSPVRRNASGRCGTLARIEDYQDRIATPENHSHTTTLYYFQSKRVVINLSAAVKSSACKTVSKILLGCIVAIMESCRLTRQR